MNPAYLLRRERLMRAIIHRVFHYALLLSCFCGNDRSVLHGFIKISRALAKYPLYIRIHAKLKHF